MTNTATDSLTDSKEKDQSAIQKIQTLSSLLSISTPTDDQAGYGEYTKYQAVFNSNEREKIKAKIMELMKQL